MNARAVGIVLLLICGAVGYWHWDTPTPPSASAEGPVEEIRPTPMDHRRVAPWRRAEVEAKPVSLVGRVSSEDGQGLAATVCVTSELTVDREQAPCRQTAADGRYEVFLPLGVVHLLSASAPGYVSQSRRAGPAVIPNLDFVLQVGGVPVQGLTVDATGGSVAGAIVTVSSPATDDIARVVSDARGRFELHAPPGEIEAKAEAPGYALARTQLVAPARDVLLAMAPGAVVVGQVVRAGSLDPVAEARVTAWVTSGLHGSFGPVRTGRDGTFRISGVPAGGYELQAIADGLRSQRQFVRVSVASESEQVTLTVHSARRVEAQLLVGDSPCEIGRVQLVGVDAPSSVVTSGEVVFPAVVPGEYVVNAFCDGAGFAQFDLFVGDVDERQHVWRMAHTHALQGRVVTEQGEGVPGQVVRCVPSGDKRKVVVAPPCRSDSQGDFNCAGFSAGNYRCSVQSSGPEGAFADVTIPAGGPMEIIADARAALRVSMSERLPGAHVIATDERGVRHVAVGAGGADFVFASLPLGQYNVGTEQEPKQAQVELSTSGETVTLDLQVRSAALAGWVVDRAGTPVVEAWVQVETAARGALGIAPGLTDDAGYFRFSPVAEGSYPVKVTSSLGEAEVVEVEAGQEETITLDAYGSLRGSVSTTDGQPATDFTITYSDGNQMQSRRISDANGVWSLPWLRVGTWGVTARARGGRAHETVDVRARDNPEVLLVLAPDSEGEADAPFEGTVTASQQEEPTGD